MCPLSMRWYPCRNTKWSRDCPHPVVSLRSTTIDFVTPPGKVPDNISSHPGGVPETYPSRRTTTSIEILRFILNLGQVRQFDHFLPKRLLSVMSRVVSKRSLDTRGVLVIVVGVSVIRWANSDFNMPLVILPTNNDSMNPGRIILILS